MAETRYKTKALAQAAVKPGQAVERRGPTPVSRWFVTGTPHTELEAASAANIAAAAGQAGPSPASEGGAGTPASDIGGGTVPEGTTTTPTPTQTQAPAPTGVPSGAMGDLARKAIQEAGLVYGTGAPAPTVPGGLSPTLRTVGEEAVKAYEAQKPIVAPGARKAQTALETQTEGTFAYQAAIDQELVRMQQTRGSTVNDFQSAVGKAETYAGEAHQRTIEGLAKIDRWGSAIFDEMDKTKAWDMEVAVQSTVESMNVLERQTLQQYGADSDEYRQFTAGKGKALSGILVNIQSSHAKLRSDTASSIMKAKSDFLTQSDMYESFQQQQDVEISAAMANAKASFELDSAAYMSQQELFKMAGWETLVNWQLETPVFGMDAMETVNFLGQLAMGEWQGAQAQAAADKASAAASSAGTKSMIGSIAGAGLMALAMWCDEGIKEDPVSIPNALDKVGHLEGYVYSFSFRPSSKDAGILAQDLEKVLPEGVVCEHGGLKYVKMDAVMGLLVNALNELADKVARLEGKVNG